MMSIRRSYLCTDCITVLDRPYSCTLDVRIGSKADENGPSAPGLLSDLKLTQFGVNRTLGHEGLLDAFGSG